MLTEVTVIRIDDGDVTYEVRDQDGDYLADRETFEAACEEAQQIAEAQGLEHYQVQVATESV